MKEFISRRGSKVAIALLVIGGAFFIGYRQGQMNVPAVDTITGLSNMTAGEPNNVDFGPFWQAWNIISEKYVAANSTTTATTTDQDKVYGAIEGLAKSLNDPYTVFFPPKEDQQFESQISGSFEGVGMEIGMKNNVITVVAPLKDTPAYRAGIKSGDQILNIDGKTTADMSVDDAVTVIRGPKGTTVRLTIGRVGAAAPFDVNVVRDTIAIPTIDTTLKPGSPTASAGGSGSGTGLRSDGIFVITLYSFTADSANLFRGAMRQFIESGSHKLILDLRGNPGGYLDAAVDMASWFLPTGDVVVSEAYANGTPPDIYRSRGYNVFAGKKLDMYILINQGSASASEILAGALQEHGVAKLLGTRSFGKGSVQELIKLTPDTALKVTVARWLTPNGKSISEQGLEPDVKVDVTQDQLDKKIDPQMDKAVQLLNQEP